MELSCTFKGHDRRARYSDDWDDDSRARLYICEISSAMITKPGTLIKSINGVHKSEKSNNDVDAIYFEDTIVKHFPRGLNKIFPNLTRLKINRCGLKKISRRDLVGLRGLVELNLNSNKIKSLPDVLFVGMSNLQIIRFCDNKISCASSKLLIPIEKQLKGADFDDNNKIRLRYDDLTPANLNELKRKLDACDKPKAVATYGEDSHFLDSFGELMWTTGKYSDFSIFADKKEFKVHKNILGTQSKFFETMFDQEMEESLTGKLTIDVFGPEVVKEFLEFLYTGKAPSTVHAWEIFKLAAMYEVPELADLCEEMIIQNIDESNVVDIVQLANVHERDAMQIFAAEFVKSLLPGRNLKDSFFNDCEAIKKIIEAKKSYENTVNSILTD